MSPRISEGEIKNVLFEKMNPGKSPGNDGLTVAFYKRFWDRLGEHYLASITEALEKGQLSSSQKQSVILFESEFGSPDFRVLSCPTH